MTAATGAPGSPGGRRYDLAELKQRYWLPDVLEARGLVLHRQGPGTFRALCPFHADRRPSFFVDVRQREDPHWYCFGCSLRGDVVDFVQRRDGLSTLGEALAKLTGAPPPAPRSANLAGAPGSVPVRDRRWDHLTVEEQLVLEAAVALYRRLLREHRPALAYLRTRGVPDAVIHRCGLGYSDGRSLQAHLRKHGGLQLAEVLGLLRRHEPDATGEGGWRELLAGRIVVPELRAGQPIWLIGRRPDELSDIKYLSLPGERPILGLERARGRREAFLVEGVFDWLTAVSWGLPAFSACGTTLPANRLGWLARTEVVWGVLDPDRAGREGSERFGATLGRRWHPLLLPEGLDLNELGQQPSGRAGFFRLLAAARRTTGDGAVPRAGAPDRTERHW